MGQSVDVVRRYFAAFGAGDVDAALACVHDRAIWHVDGDPIVGTVGVARGKPAVRAWLTRFPSQFQPLAFSVKRLFEEDEEVIAFGRFRHRVVPSGAIVDSDYAIRFTLQNGLIARYQIFEDSGLIADAFRTNDASRAARINGVPYVWDDIGSGRPIVFLHGLFLERHFFSGQIETLAATRRCIAFDMPGHGASGWREGLDLDGIAEDVALWMAEQHLEPATIVGHSQGGMVAMRIAALHPELVERLVLVNTSARAEDPDRLRDWTTLRARLLGDEQARLEALRGVQQRTTAPDWLTAHPQFMEQELATMMRHDPANLVRALDAAVLDRGDIRPLLSAIGAPTTVLSGALDEATPVALGQEIVEGIPGSSHLVVPDAAHHLPTEAPSAVLAALDR